MVQKKPARRNLDVPMMGFFKPGESETTNQHNPGKNTAKSSSRSNTNSATYVDEHFKVAHSEDALSKSDFKRETTVIMFYFFVVVASF